MANLNTLMEIMELLRHPRKGCPWDQQQTLSSLVPHTLEEAYEVADAIERDAPDELCSELGDLLFQVVFYTQLTKEQGLFDFSDVVEGITDKLIRRHPHVFGDAKINDAKQQSVAWEALKAQEREARASSPSSGKSSVGKSSVLADIPRALPALSRAGKLQKRAAGVGFDWPDVEQVWGKIMEEIAELEEALAGTSPQDRAEELGDVLFTVVNLARHLDIDPEQALRQTNAKFERRFGFIEKALERQGLEIRQTRVEEMDRLWEQAKLVEKTSP